MFGLLSARGARPFFLAIFLNAAIDLGHKVTVQNVIFKVYDGAEQVVLTALVNALILLPYIIFFLPVGAAANALPKPRLMRITACFSAVMVCMLCICYWQGWFWPAFGITFAMAIQSAFYSPAKLGYLKVLFAEKQLAAANGAAQSLAIIGILAGTLVFSIGFESLYGAAFAQAGAAPGKGQVLSAMPLLGLGLLVLVIIQLFAVYRIPFLEARFLAGVENKRSPNSIDPGLALPTLGSARQILARREFLLPMFGLALFWSAGQATLAIFPAFAKEAAGIINTAVIQAVLTCTGLGIIVGAWIVGRVVKSPYRLPTVPIGVVLMLLGLFSVIYLRSAAAYALVYLILGIASGLLIVPLNAFIQAHSSNENIGSVLATSNLFQNVAMLLVLATTIAVSLYGLSPATLLWSIALIAAVAGLA
ncbi:MAG: MFS transporter, partial [Pseudomonadales bacterium]|nr:MFS transporter [Pseudomonadales bacterium]